MRLIDADALTEVLNVKKTCEDCDYQQGMFCSKSSDFVNACEAIFDAPTIEPEPHWIPCSERLPERGNYYLVTDFGSVEDAYYGSYGWWLSRNGDKLKDVTAWMPLPEPYQEVK